MEKKQIKQKILEESQITEEDLEDAVESKVEEYNDMVSEEGALHLVAKESGIELEEASSQDLEVENVVPEMRDLKFRAKVLDVGDTTEFTKNDGEDGKVQNLVLGDPTGTIRMSLWDEQISISDHVGKGDTIQISGAYTVEDSQGNAEIRLGDNSKVKMAEEEVKAPENQGTSSEAVEAQISEIKNEGATYNIQGLVAEVYTSNPFYRVDGETGETVKQNDDGEFVDDNGDIVEEPEYRLALPAVLDDGTGNIRCVFFQERAKDILEIDDEITGDKEQIEKAAETAIGKEIEVTGNARFNDYFGRIEIVANSVEDVDYESEIKSLVNKLEA